MPEQQKVVLAYSGGLDTSVAIKWLEERYGMEVIALAVDLGENKNLEAIRSKALSIGASKCLVVDARETFLTDFAFKALKANALYEGKYPLSAGLSRPLIASLLVKVAAEEGAVAVAHGCTGKGNDQVRFDISISALNPDLKVIAPVREWPMSREEEIEYARARGIPVPVKRESPYSIDQNLWGRSIECGQLEDPWAEPPEDAWQWTTDPEKAPNEPEYVEIEFWRGIPVALDGKIMDPVELVSTLNALAGRHGVGRVDMVENRLIGIKSRELYECPAALTLITAHKDLESITLPREVAAFKETVDRKYAEVVYNGLWYSPLREALDAFIEKTQETVSGTVRLKLFKGSVTVVGRRSEFSLYDRSLATYGADVSFDHDAAVGFISIWSLPTRVYASVKNRKVPV